MFIRECSFLQSIKGWDHKGNLGFPIRLQKTPNPNHYTPSSISYPVPTAFPGLSSLEYKINIVSGQAIRIIDIVYRYN